VNGPPPTTGCPFCGIQVSYDIWETIYPQLDQYNSRTLAIEPEFATSWTTSQGGRTWTFRTRPHAEWSDGKPLTAADAAWTINTIIKFKNGPTANLGGDVAHLKNAVAPNSTTLVLHYAQPVANVLPNLNWRSCAVPCRSCRRRAPTHARARWG
jgi:peptide/nickel transport system substrate-binding protein